MKDNNLCEKKIEFVRSSLGNGVTEITAPMGEKIYVIEGKTNAMVIDTGMGIGSLKQCIDEFCSLPLVVVNTHGHPDHAGGNGEFEKVYLHPDDEKLYYQMATRAYRKEDIKSKVQENESKIYEDNLIEITNNILPLNEGHSFDLGGRTITAYKLEGHTKGSIVLYDSLTKWLFAGDAICLMDTWLHLDHSTSVTQYRDSLKRFIAQGLEIEKILTGHEPNAAPPEILNLKLECLNKIISGEIRGEDVATFAGNGKRAEYNGTGLVYNDKKII